MLNFPAKYFLNKNLLESNNLELKFNLAFYRYDPEYRRYEGKLDYSIFNDLDTLIIEINNLDDENQASSKKIINYCNKNNINVIRTFIIKFPIYPINWSGKGENKQDYLNWEGLENIDYNKKFIKCIESIRKSNIDSDLSTNIVDFIEKNFSKKLLFTHSLHPSNILLYELWRYILEKLLINIDDYKFNINEEIIPIKSMGPPDNISKLSNPFTSKMIIDLNITFSIKPNDKFYIERYNKNKNNILKN